MCFFIVNSGFSSIPRVLARGPRIDINSSQSIPRRSYYISRQFHTACLWIELIEVVDDG